MLPKDLAEFAGIAETAMFVGLGKSFQVWEPAAFEAHRSAARQRARDKNATLRIIKPGDGR